MNGRYEMSRLGMSFTTFLILLLAFAIGQIFVMVYLRREMTAIHARISRRLAYTEDKLVSIDLIQRANMRAIEKLQHKRDTPLFTAHSAICPQCHGDVTNTDEGGPSSLCEEGFSLLKEDMK